MRFRRQCRSLVAAAAALVSLVAPGSACAAEREATVAPVQWLPGMHVFRRYSGELERMFEFYGDVLGFERMPNIGQVGRVRAGASEFKLQRRGETSQRAAGGVRDATGFRLAGFYFADEAALVARFVAHGYPAPEFKPVAGTPMRVALAQDPEGQPVELIVVPSAPAATLQQLEIGLTVKDVEASRAFYRDFVGLEELPPVEDPLFGTMKYPFRHGSTLVVLRSFGAALPADTDSGLIQYIVSNLERVDELAKEQGVAITRPLSGALDAPLRTLWIADPDGIVNYFTETPQSRAAR
jgi:catechol 2,3-dioxygenase-like lactoylglutathione lyase family enzyme